MRVPRYVEESEDLKQSRQKEAREHRDFLRWDSQARWSYFWWPAQAQSFSHYYDAEVAA